MFLLCDCIDIYFVIVLSDYKIYVYTYFWWCPVSYTHLDVYKRQAWKIQKLYKPFDQSSHKSSLFCFFGSNDGDQNISGEETLSGKWNLLWYILPLAAQFLLFYAQFFLSSNLELILSRHTRTHDLRVSPCIHNLCTCDVTKKKKEMKLNQVATRYANGVHVL